MASPENSTASVPLHRSADSHEIRALTGIRGVAAFWVVIYHFYPFWVHLLPALALAERPISRGHFGVDIFFILSGFILSYVYASGNLKFGWREYGMFIWYRIARIFPNNLVTLAALVALVTLARCFHVQINGHGPYSHLPFQATLTQVWPFVPPHQAMEWVGTAWTLSAEWFAYIFIFPLLAYVHRQKWGAWICFVLSYTLLAAIYCNDDLTHWWPFEKGLLLAICEFLAGGFIFAAYLHSAALTEFCRRSATAIALLYLGLVAFAAFPDKVQSAAMVMVIPVLLVGLTTEHSWMGWLLSTPLVLWSGRISYALYLTHPVTQHFLRIVLPWPHFVHSALPVRLVVILVYAAAVLLCASLLHYTVEIRARNYMRKHRPGSR